MVRRGRSRHRDRDSRQSAGSDAAHYRRLVNPFTPLKVLSDDQVAHIHQAAVGYLADHGIRILLDEARDLFLAAGGQAGEGDDIVRIDPDCIDQALSTAPTRFELDAPNPDRSVAIGGDALIMGPVGGPPFVSDLINGRRSGTLADYENFLRLVQLHDVIAVTGPSIESSDVALNVRHLHNGRATVTLTDKPPFVYARGRRRMRDSFDIVKLRYGFAPGEDSDEAFSARPRSWTVVNTNSPRQIDIPMALGIIDAARMGQAAVLTPFTLAGAMAPVTLAGALVLQHMEALAAVTLSQLARPGAPVLYGAFTSNVDMKSGSPAFGTPESMKSALASGQLARHVGLPWRSSGSSASNYVDAQSGYETMMNTYGAFAAGANWIMHAAGWQEGGLTASYEKFIVDVEMCQMLAEVCRPVVVDDDTLALDAITEVGPGGHFFGTPHTLERFESAFYQPLVFERTNFEQWTEAGSRQTAERATVLWQQALDRYQRPPIDEAAEAAIDDFVDRRIAEGGAPTD